MMLRIRFFLLISMSFLLLAAAAEIPRALPASATPVTEPVHRAPEFSASPSVEGTGPQSAPPAGSGGGGGISVPLAGLPIGNKRQDGRNGHCVEII